MSPVTYLPYMAAGSALLFSLYFFFNFVKDLKPITLRHYLYGTTPDSTVSKKSVFFGALLGAICVTLIFVALELKWPFFFNSDDNAVQFLPQMVYGCEALLSGIFPTLNPHQLLGSPLGSLSTYALLYPLTFISFLISKFLVRDAYALIEVFAFLHLILAYLASYYLLRRIKIAPWISGLAAISLVFCGYNLIAGRSWYYMLPLLSWTPLLWGMALSFRDNVPSSRWIFSTGLIVAFFFYAGNLQMWLYSMIFFAILILIFWITSKNKPTRILACLSALLLALSLILPLLLSMIYTLEGLRRPGHDFGHMDLLQSIFAMLIPHPLVDIKHPAELGLGNNYTFFYHTGSLFTLSALFAIATVVIIALFQLSKRKAFARLCKNQFWLLLFVVAADFSRGIKGFLWNALHSIPTFSEFSWPFKFMPFMNLLVILIGAKFLHSFFYKHKQPFGKILFFISSLLLLLNVLIHCGTSFYPYGFQTYPALADEMKDTLKAQDPDYPQRIFAVSPDRSQNEDFMFSMHHNFPTVYGLYAYSGYENLLPNHRDNLSLLQNRGVRHVIFYDNAYTPEALTKGGQNIRNYPHKLVYQSANKRVRIFELEHQLPLAYLINKEALPIKFNPQGAVVFNHKDQTQDVAVNLFFRVPYRAFLDDGTELQVLRSHADQLLIRNVPPKSNLHIRYLPFKPIYGVFSFLLLVGAWLCSRGAKRCYRINGTPPQKKALGSS